MRRRVFVLGVLTTLGGCIGFSGDKTPGKEINHKQDEPDYLGVNDSHKINFKTIDYTFDRTSGKYRIYLDFGGQVPSRAEVHLYFYKEGKVVGAGVQRIDKFGTNDNGRAVINLPPEDEMKEFSGYRVAVVPGEEETDSDNLGANDPQPPERCEDENVSPDEDDPMKPNCDFNPYENGQGDYETQYLRPIEGYEHIRKNGSK